MKKYKNLIIALLIILGIVGYFVWKKQKENKTEDEAKEIKHPTNVTTPEEEEATTILTTQVVNDVSNNQIDNSMLKKSSVVSIQRD